MFRSLIFVLLSSLFFCSKVAEGTRNLSVLLMVSKSPQFNSSGSVEASELALKQINKDPSLLSGYELNISQSVDDMVSYREYEWY